MINLKVLILSNLEHNPYIDLLTKDLAAKGVEIEIKDNHTIFLPRVIKNGKPDILHVHNLLDLFAAKPIKYLPFLHQEHAIRHLRFLIFALQIFILKLLGLKIVWTIHEWKDKFGWGEIYPSWATIIGKHFDAFITHCHTTKNEIIDALGMEHQQKVFVVYHANYIDAYANYISPIQARKSLNIPSENTVFLFFGNIFLSKGILDAIDTFVRLQDSRVSLLIAGLPLEADIESIIRRQIENHTNILFIPKIVPDDEIQIYMNACDCILQPYKVFTTSGVTILAMSFAKTCIAPQVGYFSEVLDASGAWLYDVSAEDGLLQAMKLAIVNKRALTEMGKCNLEKVKHWSSDYVADETVKVYQSCFPRLN